jgi:transglutaminase superfamily protein
MRSAARVPPHARLAAPARVALVGEILVTYARARTSLRRRGLGPTLDDLRARPGARIEGNPVSTGRRLGRAVGRTLALLPTDSRCLMQSLVLTRLLARRGIETRLVIAVRPGGDFAAHAWVEHGEVALLPALADSFEELVTL